MTDETTTPEETTEASVVPEVPVETPAEEVPVVPPVDTPPAAE